MVSILIDIGCFNAITKSQTLHLLKKKHKNHKWYGYMIEPNPYLEDDIKKTLLGLDYSYHQIGISDEDGEADFYIGKYGFENRRQPKQINKCMRSSLCYDKDYIKEHLSDNKINIKVNKLKTFILENKIKKIDLLKIDTEGKDYDIILEYFKNPIILPKIIITEDVVRGDNVESQLLIAETKKRLLIKNNYEYYKVDDYNSKYILKNDEDV